MLPVFEERLRAVGLTGLASDGSTRQANDGTNQRAVRAVFLDQGP